MKPIFRPRRNILEGLPLVVYEYNCKQFIIRLVVPFLLKLYENYLPTPVLRTDTVLTVDKVKPHFPLVTSYFRG